MEPEEAQRAPGISVIDKAGVVIASCSGKTGLYKITDDKSTQICEARGATKGPSLIRSADRYGKAI